MSEDNDMLNAKVYVRYKFINDEKEYHSWLTMAQFRNLQSLSIIEYCKIVSDKNSNI
jgi:hypothetical protein